MSPRVRIVAGATAALLVTAGVAVAATTIKKYPAWTITPSDTAAQNHSGTLKFGLGSKFPNATYTVTKSADDGEDTELLNGIDGGDWFTSATPFGKAFGPTGPNSPQVNDIRYIKTRVDDDGFSTVATTTYTFKRPTPAGKLGFALSDIDVDQARITAKDDKGKQVSGKELNGKVFNFCNVVDGIPDECVVVNSAPRANRGFAYQVPVWTKYANGGLLRGANDAGDDSEGASGWFVPTVRIKSLTIVFQGVDAGAPSYRMWVAAKVKKAAKKPKPVTG